MMRINLFFPIFLLVSALSLAQSDTTDSANDLYSFSMDDLINYSIVSASREEELAFNSPVSSWAISSDEILKMGVTSIPQALRYCPSLIVKEIANGSYDVSIRGGVDGLPEYYFSSLNYTILVMIDNRPVFSSFRGGTFWQNLPVTLSNVDRIEVVAGPSSALYGPNAVSGVINILTKNQDNIGVFANGNLQYGNFGALGSVRAGYKSVNGFGVEAVFGADDRQRFSDLFWDNDRQEYVVLDSVSSENLQETKDERFPNISQSIQKVDCSVKAFYDSQDGVSAALSFNRNESSALMPLANSTALSVYTNTSNNVYFQGAYHDFSFQASYLEGVQSIAGNMGNNKYNYSNTDLYVDYKWSVFNEKLSIKPALSYQRAYANDKEYTVDVGDTGTFNNEGFIENMAASLKLDYSPNEKLRFVLGSRYDHFNHPSKGTFSYQGVVNYLPSKNHVIRFISSKSSSGSFLLPIFLESTYSYGPSSSVSLFGNMETDLLSNTSQEIGYRGRFSDNLIIDVSYFYQFFEGFNTYITQLPEITVFPVFHVNSILHTTTLPLVAKQNGLTVSVQGNFLADKLQVKGHCTIQHTQLDNYSSFDNVKGAYDIPNVYTFEGHKDSTWSKKSTGTPGVWAGLNILYRPIPKLFISTSATYYSNYNIHSNLELDVTNGQIEDSEASNINEKLIFNANISYEVLKFMTLNISGRNLLNESSAEGFGTDLLGRYFYIGANLKL